MSDSAAERFDRTTSRWGWTMLSLALVVSLAGPASLMFGAGQWPGFEPVFQSWLGVASIFAVIWILEPATYFPMIGPAATYQAFLIGNISNKLLPAAMAAQASGGFRPGTRKAEITTIVAISGAAAVHAVSLVLFVGVLGNWVLSTIPASCRDVFAYIVPAVFGPVLVQAILSVTSWRTAAVSITSGAAVYLLLVKLLPSTATYAMAICVVGAVGFSIVCRTKEVPEATAMNSRASS